MGFSSPDTHRIVNFSPGIFGAESRGRERTLLLVIRRQEVITIRRHNNKSGTLAAVILTRISHAALLPFDYKEEFPLSHSLTFPSSLGAVKIGRHENKCTILVQQTKVIREHAVIYPLMLHVRATHNGDVIIASRQVSRHI